jgi:hypothetical protein
MRSSLFPAFNSELTSTVQGGCQTTMGKRRSNLTQTCGLLGKARRNLKEKQEREKKQKPKCLSLTQSALFHAGYDTPAGFEECVRRIAIRGTPDFSKLLAAARNVRTRSFPRELRPYAEFIWVCRTDRSAPGWRGYCRTLMYPRKPHRNYRSRRVPEQFEWLWLRKNPDSLFQWSV